jgi:hypothetical protein
MADSWRDGILLKVPYSFNPFSQSHSFPGLERNRLYPLPWFKYIDDPRRYLHPKQADLYHACPMGISHLVCSSTFVQRSPIYFDSGH